MAYSTKATLRDPSVAEAMNFVTESQQCAVDKELNSTIKLLGCPGIVQIP